MPFFKCQACQNHNINLITFLGFLPPVNDLREDTSQESIDSYPLPFCSCSECGLVQLGIELDKEVVFPKSYPYLSGMTSSLVRNFAEQAQEVNKLLQLTKSDYVLDIGSNDGSLLKQYIKFSSVIGVEPTNAAIKANSNGIRTINSYFDEKSILEIKNITSTVKLVTACNVFAHIPNLSQLLKNIKSILGDDGIFVSESHYLLDLLENLQFDTIYHEHLRYYDVTFLNDFFKINGFHIFRVERIKSHGGSIRVWATASSKLKKESSVDSFIEFEKLNKINYLNDFPSRLNDWRDSFRQLITVLKKSGAEIGAMGAPSRASTLVSFAGLSDLDIIAVGELPGSAKIGKFMPGTRIPIVIEDEILRLKPTHLLILSWHLSSSIIDSLKSKGFEGKFIVPLPTPRIVN